MRKIFYSLILLLSLFIFSDNAYAVVTEETGGQFCYYQLDKVPIAKGTEAPYEIKEIDFGLQVIIPIVDNSSGNGFINPKSPGQGTVFSFPTLSYYEEDGEYWYDMASFLTIKAAKSYKKEYNGGVLYFFEQGFQYAVNIYPFDVSNGKCPDLYFWTTVSGRDRGQIHISKDKSNQWYIPLTNVEEVNDFDGSLPQPDDEDVDPEDGNGFIDDTEIIEPEILAECDQYDYLFNDALHGALKMRTRLIKEYGTGDLRYQINFYIPAVDASHNYETSWEIMYATGDGIYPYKNPAYIDVFKINNNAIDMLKADLDNKTCSSYVYANHIRDNGYEISSVSDGSSTRDNFDALIGAMYNPMQALDSKILDYKMFSKYGKKGYSLKDFRANNDVCSFDECKTNILGYVEKSLRNVKQYCNEKVYKRANPDDVRLRDCLNFEKFYNHLVAEGYINDYAEGCNFISEELREKIIFVLDLLKIAGPILALGLGTLDFVKVLANGDADKEMKTAFRKFTIRIAAAILLFIIPIILAFLLDTFIGNQDGYDSDNPFCSVVEWEE